MSKNLLKIDPQRMQTLRRVFITQMRKRLRSLQKALIEGFTKDDRLGLKPSMFVHDNENRFVFKTTHQKLQEYLKWMKDQIRAKVLDTDVKGNIWASQYVESAYRKGAVRAYIEARKQDLFTEPSYFRGGIEQFLRTAFASPERIGKLQILYTRVYEELKGISEAMSQKLARVLTDGMAHGYGMDTIARNIREQVYGIERKRALVLARTELANAHSEGSLDSYEEMGIDELNAYVEWSTAEDEKVCPLCLDLEGVTYTVDEARGILPRHPNCRCAWIPALEEGRKKK